MSNFLKYAWAKRSKLWSRRDVAFVKVGRQLVRMQYRITGFLAIWAKFVAPASTSGLSHLKVANPFIEYEIGRLRIKPAPIPTTIRESYSQCNEDIIVEGLLRANLSNSGRQMSTLKYLEIGGNHPVQTSSTYLFYRAWGAQGYIVEANEKLSQRLQRIRPRDQIFQTAVSDSFEKTLSFHVHELDELSSLSRESILDESVTGVIGEVVNVETVPNLHINDFFNDYIHEHLDFMSIDIEGMDVRVLKALSSEHRPTVLQVECYNDDTLSELKKTLEPRSYKLFAVTDINVIFVQR